MVHYHLSEKRFSLAKINVCSADFHISITIISRIFVFIIIMIFLTTSQSTWLICAQIHQWIYDVVSCKILVRLFFCRYIKYPHYIFIFKQCFVNISFTGQLLNEKKKTNKTRVKKKEREKKCQDMKTDSRNQLHELRKCVFTKKIVTSIIVNGSQNLAPSLQVRYSVGLYMLYCSVGS